MDWPFRPAGALPSVPAVTTPPGVSAPPGRAGVRRCLRPLYAGAFLQNVTLWVPVEKLFMTSIGFTTATIGVMAALYALVVPLLEVPSGVLADRWSRRGVLVVAMVALAGSVTVGGLSPDVGWYLAAAALLGVCTSRWSPVPTSRCSTT